MMRRGPAYEPTRVIVPVRKMNIFLQLIAIVSLQQGSVVVNGNYVLTSSCGGVVTEGSSCVLTCETGDVTETPIAWTPSTSASYEVKRASCTTSDPGVPSDYVLACPGTSFTLTITAASVTRDKTIWTCAGSFGGKESDAINLDVKGTPGNTDTSTAVAVLICSNIFLCLAIIAIGIFIAWKRKSECIVHIIRKVGVKLYHWIYFILGILEVVFGLAFLITIIVTYEKALGEGLPAAALSFSISIMIDGIVIIITSFWDNGQVHPSQEEARKGSSDVSRSDAFLTG